MSTAGPLTSNRPERVAVIIPAKNEAERIESTIRAARSIVGVDLVVVVDDGSTDATAAVAMGADALVVRHKTNRGKAAAMATGGQLVAMREEADRADGGEGFREELHAEPRSPGHTGPLPVIDGAFVPRALLFLDADMGDSASAAQPLVDAVLGDGVDMAIALLPPQAGASGMGIVVRTARAGILRATGWEPTQPLSGTRCITRETWDACQPLAPGWGVETSLSIDALTGGFWVKEIECDLHHRATGRDLSGQLHRAAQLKDVVRALARRRHVAPEEPVESEEFAETAEPAVAAEPIATEEPVESEERMEPELSGHPEPVPSAPPAEDDQPHEHTQPHEDDAPSDRHRSAWTAPVEDDEEVDAWSSPVDDQVEARARRRREDLSILPVDGEFSDDETRQLGDVDVSRLDAQLRALPVDGEFAPDDVVFLAGTDLDALGRRLSNAPVIDRFDPEHAVIIASHPDVPEPELPPSITPPLTCDEYTSLVIHAAVDAENEER